jgi:5-(carboxyamino)imidazole ribonucleotide mutase
MTATESGVEVAVVMGSSSDLPTLRPALDTLTELGVTHDVAVVSAHRDPHGMLDFADRAAGHGYRVIIAAAGGAAHLPGMIASATSLPVIGVPVPRPHLDGLDGLLSMVQMPDGIPVATVAIGGAANAALLAVRILATSDPARAEQLDLHRGRLRAHVVLLNDEVAQQLHHVDGWP